MAVAVGSFIPDSWKIRLLVHGPLHLPIHVLVFMVSGFLVFGREQSPRRRTIAFIGLIALGVLLESLQRAIYPIRFEWRDLLADTGGVVLAMAVTAMRSPNFKIPNLFRMLNSSKNEPS